ncbi:hypothetical protein ACI79C_23340 [Geodermatophilus sp. SYSU D00697]
MSSTNIALNFPDDQAREDFEIAFRGWLKQYQQQAGVSRALIGGSRPGGGGGGGQGSTGGLTGGGAGAHSYGGGGGQGQGQEAGLLSLGSGSYGGGTVKDLYLNLIGGW